MKTMDLYRTISALSYVNDCKLFFCNVGSWAGVAGKAVTLDWRFVAPHAY